MSEKPKKRPNYSSEFKAAAVAKCLEIGVNATSRELGVSYVTLRNWVSTSESAPTSGAKPTYDQLEKENRKLRREIGYINAINRVLKKGTAIFSASEMGGFK